MEQRARGLSIVVTALIAPILATIAATVVWGDRADLFLQVMLLAIMLPLLALSAYMWITGKGAMLVAGYNTSPKAVRDLYEPVSMVKFVGRTITIFVLILLAGIELLVFDVDTVLFLILLVLGIMFLIASIVYMNTGGRFLKEGANPSKVVVTAQDRRRSRMIALAVLGGIAVILVAVFLFAGSGSVSASLEDNALVVKAPFVDERLVYTDITSVELRDTFDNGRRVGGFGGIEISSGGFENNEFGRYTLARYNNVDSCIVVHHAGGVLVFNLETADGTVRAFEDLRSRT